MPLTYDNPNKEVYVTAWYDNEKFGDGYLRPTVEGVAEFRLKCYQALAPRVEKDSLFKRLLIGIPGGKA